MLKKISSGTPREDRMVMVWRFSVADENRDHRIISKPLYVAVNFCWLLRMCTSLSFASGDTTRIPLHPPSRNWKADGAALTRKPNSAVISWARKEDIFPTPSVK